ncbi:gamma-glutamyltransferase family protein [Candidatus Poriferisocius sp.]|uniref:gamma-glutamyltransferase family protein n=1 Tax=Candidatus Poriferisocius sp. TaxID=3101276 RepID=UPI003B5D0057
MTSFPGHQPQRVATSNRGMVSTAHPGATAAGATILEAGGNAVDAAVAAALALGVCEPAASGLGGQTMMMIHLADEGRTIALDGSSRAPHRATVESFGDLARERRRGHRATTVPSSPATYDYALSRYGALGLGDVLQPAIRLAEEGYEVSELQERLTTRERKHLRRSPGAASLFLRHGRHPYRKGAVFRQPVLASTLGRLATVGMDDFYHGEIARLIAADMDANGGLIQADDLAQIPVPIEREPLDGRFHDLQVHTMPPPGAGRTLIQMMNVYQSLPSEPRDLDSPDGAVLFAETIRQAFQDRQDRPFHPEVYPQVDEKVMLSRKYARRLASRIHHMAIGKGETTHLSVMDAAGNAVALTQSIENVYGACAASPELGFLYNNYLSAYEYEDATHPYYLRPNAVPWASVAPTLAFSDGQCCLAIGSPGSERIAPAVLQVMIRLEEQSPPAAVDAPRLHCSLDGEVSLEAPRMSDEIPAALEQRGFTVRRREAYAFYLGCVQLVKREGDQFIGVADPRRDGTAAGPG